MQASPKCLICQADCVVHDDLFFICTQCNHYRLENIDFNLAEKIYYLPFNDLLFKAHMMHRNYFNPNHIQMSQLLSIKTGGCPEDCAYCSQSVCASTKLNASKLMEVDQVIACAKEAKKKGATRYCMGAAWRSPKERDMDKLLAIIHGVKSLGMETCMTLGMLSQEQANQLAQAGLDYYNHNIDTSSEYYSEIITTRTFADRLDTLDKVRQSGMNVCSGGILGMGETIQDRISMLVTLASLSTPPESVPINMLSPIPGTKLADSEAVHGLDFVRIIALSRLLMPMTFIRLSAGRKMMSDELQALCFFAGANSVHMGETLLTTNNISQDRDVQLFARLGLKPLEQNMTLEC